MADFDALTISPGQIFSILSEMSGNANDGNVNTDEFAGDTVNDGPGGIFGNGVGIEGSNGAEVTTAEGTGAQVTNSAANDEIGATSSQGDGLANPTEAATLTSDVPLIDASSEESAWTAISTSTTFTSQPSATPSSSSDSQNDNDDDGGGGGGGMSNGTKIAIAVPVALVGAAILAAILFFLLRRRRRQRQLNAQPVISTRHLETSSSVFLPQQPPVQSLPPPPPVAPISRRAVPQQETIAPPASSEAATVVPASAARDLEWRTSEERAEETRPRSPFDHPHDNDDALSFVSGMSDREAMMRARERDDDLSSVSSFEDEPSPAPNPNRGTG
ncbi:hypothetical protein BJY04DRAFT_68054 [Aspergillus karnatakaensis]|uniref:uncharacterized protein n=1 Tax=Aspergillus karnatakaensis TaxID=1810916 RepID=UPI003CCE3F14